MAILGTHDIFLGCIYIYIYAHILTYIYIINIWYIHWSAHNVGFQSHNDHRQNQLPVDHILCCPANTSILSLVESGSEIQRSWYNFEISSPVDWAKDKYHQDSHLSPSPNPSSWYLPPRTGRSGSRFPGGYNVAITKPSLGQQGCILHFPRLRVMNMGITWIWELKIMLKYVVLSSVAMSRSFDIHCTLRNPVLIWDTAKVRNALNDRC